MQRSSEQAQSLLSVLVPVIPQPPESDSQSAGFTSPVSIQDSMECKYCIICKQK